MTTNRPAAARGLPDYDPLQAAFHHSFRDELYGAIDAIGLTPGCRVLDAPCGDGFYAHRLAESVGPAGKVTLVDGNPAYLDRARQSLSELSRTSIEFVRADVYHLPFADATFDFIWCAQSLISLADARRVLAEFARVAVRDGRLAVLEADEFHHLLLPWPVELEIAIQRALARTAEGRYGSSSRLAPSRYLRKQLSETGWQPIRKVTFASDRQVPFPKWEREFLIRHLAKLTESVRPAFPVDQAQEFDRLTNPESPLSFPNDPDSEMTCLNVLHLARKPS